MNLTLDQVRELARLERDMDAGEQPFVILNGMRIAVMPEIMRHFELVTGQTISMTLCMEITQASIAACTRFLDEEEAKGETR